MIYHAESGISLVYDNNEVLISHALDEPMVSVIKSDERISRERVAEYWENVVSNWTRQGATHFKKPQEKGKKQ